MLEFIHIPKTAGMSICTAIGQQPGHRLRRPRAINQDAFIFSCIRNPYDRAVSMYYFLTDKAPHYRAHMMAKRETVNTYWQRADKMALPIRFIQPQKAWLQDIERIDKLIRFETLEKDWAEMQQAFNLPDLEHKNITSKPATQWQDELTQESIAKIGELYSEDFERFGYDRI